ncbi:MAG: creatininase family protein [Ruminococcaceae bacterium]|nr:creatininase family protein [Oscillospiraceae bacterium]
MLWTEILSGDFEAAVEKSKGVCGLVVGCVEHHGKHLPLGQDVYHAAGVAERAAEKEPIVLFPHQYFGEKQGAGEFKGTIIFSSKLLFDILDESCKEMARNGFKKIILINGHGGNNAMLNNFARSVLHDKNEYMVFVYNSSKSWPKALDILEMIDNGQRDYFPELTDEDIALLKNYAENCTTKGHGCLMETAMTLGCRPDLVDLSRVNDVDGRSVHYMDHITKAGFYTPFGWMSDYPNSLSSDCHDGNNERIGRSVLKYATDKMAEAFKIIKEDTACEAYLKQWLKKQ